MKVNVKEVTNRALLEYKIKCQMPETYMLTVFGVTMKQDPELYCSLLNAQYAGGVAYLQKVLPEKYRQKLKKYLSR